MIAYSTAFLSTSSRHFYLAISEGHLPEETASNGQQLGQDPCSLCNTRGDSRMKRYPTQRLSLRRGCKTLRRLATLAQVSIGGINMTVCRIEFTVSFAVSFAVSLAISFAVSLPESDVSVYSLDFHKFRYTQCAAHINSHFSHFYY